MIADIDPLKSFVASVVSVAAGTFHNFIFLNSIVLTHANTAFQHAAWTVAILAGVVSIVNGIKKWFCKDEKKETE